MCHVRLNQSLSVSLRAHRLVYKLTCNCILSAFSSWVWGRLCGTAPSTGPLNQQLFSSLNPSEVGGSLQVSNV